MAMKSLDLTVSMFDLLATFASPWNLRKNSHETLDVDTGSRS